VKKLTKAERELYEKCLKQCSTCLLKGDCPVERKLDFDNKCCCREKVKNNID